MNFASIAVAAGLLAAPVAAEPPKVATDIAPVHSLAARVMQGVGTPDLIVRPGASPHGYSLRPSEAAALEAADVVFWVGAPLTPWLARTIETLAGDARHVGLLDQPETRTLEIRTGATFAAHDHHAPEADAHDDHDHAHDGHDHAHDDHDHAHEHEAEHDHGGAHDHEGVDPHAWMDPANGKAWLEVIAEELAQLDPENAETYRANAAAGKQEIEAVTAEIATALAPLREVEFIVFHDAYQYFEIRFDIPAAGAIALSDASDPSPARVEAIRDMVAARDIACAFAEPQFDPGILDAVFSGTGTRTAVIDPMGTEIATGADFYPRFLRSIAASFETCR
ncbi:zinc ABC transporter substrate-binding protein [Roseovarius salinarum]|uniref:zinc ABC transporter substrate-binding protein n=1 Tax=Roseovarius salinarum TaxID=1981892 RepID=UPI001E638D29|nr:zinc ABC transporter substrate-binding protein [Roseovarius salinarum]